MTHMSKAAILQAMDRIVSLTSDAGKFPFGQVEVAQETLSVAPPSFGQKGWKGYMCDTGSRLYGRQITVIYDFNERVPKRKVSDSDALEEDTYLWLLRANDDDSKDIWFKLGDNVSIYDPGDLHDGMQGVISEEHADKGKLATVTFPVGGPLTVYTKNMKKIK